MGICDRCPLSLSLVGWFLPSLSFAIIILLNTTELIFLSLKSALLYFNQREWLLLALSGLVINTRPHHRRPWTSLTPSSYTLSKWTINKSGRLVACGVIKEIINYIMLGNLIDGINLDSVAVQIARATTFCPLDIYSRTGWCFQRKSIRQNLLFKCGEMETYVGIGFVCWVSSFAML